jgi:hypothetical protein
MNFTQKSAILSLVFLSFSPLSGSCTPLETVTLINQSLYGFKLSIVNMPVASEGYFFNLGGSHGYSHSSSQEQGTGLTLSRPALTHDVLRPLTVNFQDGAGSQSKSQWTLSYEFDDFALSLGANINQPFYADSPQMFEQANQAQDYSYFKVGELNVGGEYRPMDWLTFSLNFHQGMADNAQDVFALATKLDLNRSFSVQFIGLLGSDTSKGALLKTSYHF